MIEGYSRAQIGLHVLGDLVHQVVLQTQIMRRMMRPA